MFRYLALGDSYTNGDSVEPRERFSEQLAVNLRADGVALEGPEQIALGGWTTDELRSAMVQRAPRGPYDLVTLLIGVNNQFRGRSVTEYRPEFVDLLERAIALAGGHAGHVIVISIPDYGVTPRGKARGNVASEIDAFNAVNRAEAARLGCKYLDITPGSREALHDPALIASDGLHMSGKMYARWAAQLEPLALEILGKSSV